MYQPMRLLGVMALACVAAVFCRPAYGQPFLFEDVPEGNYAGGLTVTSGGQTLRVTPEGFPSGTVTVLLRAGPLDHGVVGNQGATPVSGLFAPLRFTFAIPISSITFGFMDAPPGGSGGDIDGSVTIRAFDSSNTLLGTMVYVDPLYDGGTYQTLSGNFAGASYFIASTASPPDNLNSMVYEVVTSTVVPEPSCLALLTCFGMIGGLYSFRRRR